MHSYKILVGKLKGRDHMGDRAVNGRIMDLGQAELQPLTSEGRC
jgi:hypothetical protein